MIKNLLKRFNKERNNYYFSGKCSITTIETYIGYKSWLDSEIIQNNEFKSFILTMNNLKKIKHPLIEVSKEILNSNIENYLYPGFVVMILSKYINCIEFERNLNKIHYLSQATDFINIGFTLHNILSNRKMIRNNKDIELYEKLIILGGDLFFSYACKVLSLIEIPKVVEKMSISILYLSIKNSIIKSSRLNGLTDFLNYINWRYVPLIKNAFDCIEIIYKNSTKTNDLMYEFIKLFTQIYSIKIEINLLNKLISSPYLISTKNNHILNFYSKNYSPKLILDELIEFNQCQIYHIQSLFNENFQHYSSHILFDFINNRDLYK